MTPHSSHHTSKDTQDTLSIQGDTTIAVIKEDALSLEASMITCTPQMQERQKKRKRKSLKKSAHKSWRDWLVRLGTSARVLSFLALLMVLSMWSESVEYSKSNNLLQGSIASIDMSGDTTRTEGASGSGIMTDIEVIPGAAGSDLLDIRFTKSPRALQKMEISLVYDAGSYTIGGALTTLPGCQSSTQEIISGLTKIQLECNKSLDLSRDQTILSLPVTKKKSESTSIINMVEASFTTKDQTTYKLSTPSITH